MLGVLNSSLADYYIRSLGVTRNGGYFEYKPMFVEKMPILQLSEKDGNYNNLEKLEDAKRYDEIDYLVFSIYGLTTEEIEFIK